MAIKEKDLQTVQSTEGGKLRCVTANGESRNILADVIQSFPSFVIDITYDEGEDSWILNTPFSDIQQAHSEGKVILLRVTGTFIEMYFSRGGALDDNNDIVEIDFGDNSVFMYDNKVYLTSTTFSITSEGVGYYYGTAEWDATITS